MLREIVFAHFFGVGAHADVFRAALRAPNVLQNLLGEGTLSAAFIPIYSAMRSEGRDEQARRFAGAVFGLMLVVVLAVAGLGVLLARPIVMAFAPGFAADASAVATGELSVDRFEATVRAVRIVFPMTAILVLSAWALGVLNSHRRFFVSYAAPVAWNAAIVASLVGAAEWWLVDDAPYRLSRLLTAVFAGALAGAVMQFAIQWPSALRCLGGLRLSFSPAAPGVRDALRRFGPALMGRGVYQLSAWLDLFLASFLAAGAVAALGYAQVLYLLPISLFGMSVAAAALPELSRDRGKGIDVVRAKAIEALSQMGFLTIPTIVGYLVLGSILVSALFEHGEFGSEGRWLTYLVLSAYSLGLLATTASRLFQNVFFALGDTRTPARIAVYRMIVSAVSGAVLMLWLDSYALRDLLSARVGAEGSSVEVSGLHAGALGLALGSALGAWIEWWRLARALRLHGARVLMPWRRLAGFLAMAVASVIPPAIVWSRLPGLGAWAALLVVVLPYALIYLLLARLRNLSEWKKWLG